MNFWFVDGGGFLRNLSQPGMYTEALRLKNSTPI